MQNNYKIIEIEDIKDFLYQVLGITKTYKDEDYNLMEWLGDGPRAYTGAWNKEIETLGNLYCIFKWENKKGKKYLKENKNGEIYWYKMIEEATYNAE